MENKKFNWNKLLSGLIIGLGVIFLALVIGLCLINPKAYIKANALTKQNIVDDYNIYFKSAKTRIREADNYQRVWQRDNKNSSFYSYAYNYTDNVKNAELYRYSGTTNKLDSFSSELGNVYLSVDNQQFGIYEKYSNTSRTNEFIPNGVDSFKNDITGSIEDIFYDECDNGDFVLLNNYKSHNSTFNNDGTQPFNVENFYLSIGTSYNDETTHTTPIYDLRVEGMLYAKGKNHILKLDDNQAPVELENQKGTLSHYWYQYFDLHNLYAKNSADSNDSYAIEDTQGKYVITFHFNRYVFNETSQKWIPSGVEEVFNYTFYLLDSSNYDTIPTLNNATLGSISNDQINEYFYNFTTNKPYLSFDPESFNVTLRREFREIDENITSTYRLGQFTVGTNGIPYTLGTITFNNETKNKIEKQVYILVYYNEDKNLVEYLYLTNNKYSNGSLVDTSLDTLKYTAIEEKLSNDELKFEYKITQILNTESLENKNTRYTTTTYYTNTYKKHNLSVSENLFDTNNSSTEYFEVTEDGEYYYSSDGTSIKLIATITNSKRELNITDLKADAGITIDKSSLENADLSTSTSKLQLTNYKLVEQDASTKITKTYWNQKEGVDENHTQDIALDTKINGTFEIIDPIDSYLTINYIVENNQVTSLTIVNHTYTTKNPNANTKVLNRLNNLNELPIDISYNLTIEDLGLYTFDYKYNILCYNGTNLTESIVNNKTNSTNITKITDYALDFETSEKQTVLDQKDIKLNVWGYLDKNNTVTLNGIKYIYNAAKNEITIDGTSSGTVIVDLSTSRTYKSTVGNISLYTAYAVQADSNGQLYLTVTYNLATLNMTNKTESQISKLFGQNYISNDKNIVEHKIELSTIADSPNIISSGAIGSDSNWKNIANLVAMLEDSNATEFKTKEFKTNKYTTSSPIVSQDILHVFGSIAYFNKKDTNTNSKTSKLEQVDSKLKTNYVSDITKYVSVNNYVSNSYDFNSFQKFTNTAIANGLKAKDLIVTDIAPVSWNNLSSLLYNSLNLKLSESIIYRYTKYSIKDDGTIDYGTVCKKDTYTKDVQCQPDGLYEVVVFYKYDGYKSLDENLNYSNAIFYQLFTFIIDNSSPKLTIKLQDEDASGNKLDSYSTSLGLNKYTNKNIQISWDIPSYFKNDVYIDIERTAFDDTSSNDFVATYKQGKIIVENSSKETYVNSITRFEKPTIDDTKYFVYLTSDQLSCNGNYKVTLHYSSRGSSSVTEEFVVDKIKISGTKTLPAVQNANGTYSVNSDANYDANAQIVNYNFTFRYSPKQSGAQIYTYVYKIDLIKTADYDNLIAVDNKQGITTTYKVDGTNSDIGNGNQYSYDFKDDDTVLSSNFFKADTSKIYLFKMVDEAGNECRYVVFCDKTTPRFILTPTPANDATKIVNDTTKLIWGDYKAILINTPEKDPNDASKNYEINTSKGIDNYTKLPSTITDNLQESLVYLNTSSSLFNDTFIKLINGNYYLLLPISEVQVKDESSLSTADSQTTVTFESNLPTEYYFFPKNPISVEGNETFINLPEINNNKIIRKYNEKVDSVTFSQVVNSDNERFDRFLQTKNKDYYGAFGQGEFTYQIYDKLRNKVEGYIWMNLDKTQTMAQGIFDSKTADDPSKATPLTGEEGTYSVSKLYISSLDSTEDQKIPSYELTYKFYKLNDSLYEKLLNYNIESIKILSKADSTEQLPIIDKQTYLELVFKSKTDSTTLTYHLELTNEDGKKSIKHSYPYDLDGLAVVREDGSDTPQHIYKNNKSNYQVEEGNEENKQTRIYSTIINPTADSAGKSSVVTEEGLYIFKRTYTQATEEDLGEDERIIYRVYYVDRTGIINVTTLNSIAEQLSDAQDFGFILGSDYKDNSQKKYINSDSIKNSQVEENNTGSNSYNSSKGLFTTNKIQVQFNVTADKYNFNSFYNHFFDKLIAKASEIETKNTIADNILQNNISTYLFFKDYYSLNLYKLNLTLSKGNVEIIDESNTDSTKVFNTTAISNYLKGKYTTNGTRDNSFNLFLEDNNSNPYNIYLKDKAGYRLWQDGAIADSNYQANQLDMSFYIKHNAPEGDSYGKYYGRHDYDEDKNSNHSIPLEEYIDEEGKVSLRYALLSKYLQDGQLEPLSTSYKSTTTNAVDGQLVTLYSTNNETLIFTFSITQSDTMAKIDPNNIQVYKGGKADDQLIFNRINGSYQATRLMPDTSRMASSFFANEINGVTYYAIVIFDNNLDEILNDDEKESSYAKYRLLDKVDNPDKEKYFIKINYVGDKDNYVKEDNQGNRISYFSTTYEVTIDRNKPTYNLTKLMSLDKYVFNDKIQKVSTSNYEQIFESYKEYYNFTLDQDFDFEKSYLENYFFALDYRPQTSFVFESVSELDSNGGIYIRAINNTNYKFSITPDDYKSYYEATYLPGHPQFSPSSAKTLSKEDTDEIAYNSTNNTSESQYQYYYIPYGTFKDNDGSNTEIKASDLMQFLRPGNYYEIIEEDEAKNYRVYAVYLPEYEKTQLEYEYKINSNSTKSESVTIRYNTNTITSASGVEFNLLSYSTTDYFAKAGITIDSTKLKETIYVIYDPIKLCVYVKDSKNNILETYASIAKDDFQTTFINTINNLIKKYNDKVSDTNNKEFYTQYGYTIKLVIFDRLGIQSNISDDLYNYEITYNVAGSVLQPKFEDLSDYFILKVPAQTGTTYITRVKASIFSNGWNEKGYDDAKPKNSFNKTSNEFRQGDSVNNPYTTFTLNKGVYKFEITDNFQRTNVYFHEFGTSTTQAGGVLKFNNKSITHTDGYTYTSETAKFVYDSSVYDIYIRFIGELDDEVSFGESETPNIIYSSNNTYSEFDLRQYGITIATIDNITTITFLGVQDLSKYHIKTVPARISSEYGYTWEQEKTDNRIMVYDNKLAIYTGIQDVIIRNSNGNVLDTSEHLTLSEDFEVAMAWSGEYNPEKQIDFDSKIYLERTYTENNVVKVERISNASSYRITKPGEYVAYVINGLNKKSSSISFTRGDTDIGIYSVFNVNNKKYTKLNSSTKVDSDTYVTEEENRTLIVFNYYTTIDYFSFRNNLTGSLLELDQLPNSKEDSTDYNISDIVVDKTATKFVDIQVKSDLGIFVELHNLCKLNETPYAEYRIFSKNSDNEVYTYRFVRIYFLDIIDGTDYKLAKVSVKTADATDIYNDTAVIKRPDNLLTISFKFKEDGNDKIKYVAGNTIYIDRYFNNEFVETMSYTNIDENPEATFTLTQVGLYKFVVRDLAGRTQTFGTVSEGIKSLQIYLINQILFTVNDQTPINNQVFNDDVNIKIQSTLAGLPLYNTKTLGITVTLNDQEIEVSNLSEHLFTSAGAYTVTMIATTVLSDDSSTVTDQEIKTVYKFVIVKTNVAMKSFNISKGTGFVIEKMYKIVNNERQDITASYESAGKIRLIKNTGTLYLIDGINKMDITSDYTLFAQSYDPTQEYTLIKATDKNGKSYTGTMLTSEITLSKDSLIWLTHENEGNSIFEITLKYYNSAMKQYQSFTFNVWINNEQPVIISNIPDGTSSKETIILNFNPGMIYSQIGKCSIEINGKTYLLIDENSERNVETININQKGTYWIRIISDDGTLISSYKFTKNNPISNTTKIVLICVAVGVVVLVVLFLLIRRKGRYR